MWLLYNLLLTITAPFWVFWMLWRAHQRGEKPNWKERQGDYRDSIPKKGERPRLWVHTVSVGEFVASKPLLKALRKKLPQHEIVLSLTTSSGHQTARESEPGLYDYLVYLPIDIPRFAFSAMQRVQPDALIVLETELWMNLFWAAKAFKAKTFIVNARLSDRSFPKAQKLRAFYISLLRMVDHVLAQSETDAERFRALGAGKVSVAGNIKFDQAAQVPHDPERWQRELGLSSDRPVVVVGSLRFGEFDSFVAEVAALLHQGSFVIAPRHLERTPDLAEALRIGAPTMPVAYRSKGETMPPGGVLILDSYGELAEVYAAADIAIVGGGFADLGGQNILQPLAHGVPTLHGFNMKNFRDVVDLAVKAGATKYSGLIAFPEPHMGAQMLRFVLAELLESVPERQRMSAAARSLISQHIGASDRIAITITHEISDRF
jgi:3-deoxy-D-manno-octulosonic-acid transferase